MTENLTCEIPAGGAPTGLMESLGYMVAFGYVATLGYVVAQGRVWTHVWMELWCGDWKPHPSNPRVAFDHTAPIIDGAPSSCQLRSSRHWAPVDECEMESQRGFKETFMKWFSLYVASNWELLIQILLGGSLCTMRCMQSPTAKVFWP